MIGVNVGVPAPMAWFPFTGWNRSFFGDLHIQGQEGIQFYTRQKVSLVRWPQPSDLILIQSGVQSKGLHCFATAV